MTETNKTDNTVLREAMRFANAWNDGIAEVSTIELERLLNDLEAANHRAEMFTLQLDVATDRSGINFQRAIAAEAEHSDDFHFDLFAACCKDKLATARDKGRSGWDNAETCSVEHLAELLVHHLTKGNTGTFEDIANFAMMLHQRSADPKVLASAVRSLRFTASEKEAVERALSVTLPKPLERCAAARDGECNHHDCPQLRDNEPAASGQHCPIDTWEW